MSIKRQENYDFLPLGLTARKETTKGLERSCVGSAVAVCGINFMFLNVSPENEKTFARHFTLSARFFVEIK